MAGADPGPPSPVPEIPDVYAAVYVHAGPPESGDDRPRSSAPRGGEAASSARRGGEAASCRRDGAALSARPGGEAALRHGGEATLRPGGEATLRRGGEAASAWRGGEAAASDLWLGPWEASWTAAEHAAAVSEARAAIGRGDVYVVNVVGHSSAAYAGDPGPALARVAALPGARYGGVLGEDGWALATASPETLVEVRAGRVITRPIKGTRAATAAGRRELLASAKERAEHIMIVDLERNDLARLGAVGPVRVDELFGVRRWCDLWQAESVISAPIEGELSLAELLRSICPGGSVTGAPKRAALAEIARLEPVGRGVSMGAVGWIGPDHVDLGLSIRTVAATRGRLHVWAGGGITWDSDPAEEVAEAAAKSAPIRTALAGGSS